MKGDRVAIGVTGNKEATERTVGKRTEGTASQPLVSQREQSGNARVEFLKHSAQEMPMKSLMTPLALLFGIAGGQVMADTASNPLDSERWHSRPLILVAPNANDATWRQFQQDLMKPANREAFIEREMVLYTVIDGVGNRNDQALDPQATSALLSTLGVKPDGPTRLLLVGKDGDTKVDQHAPLDARAIFAIIDKMPMRQNP
jgi:hypothetical protein